MKARAVSGAFCILAGAVAAVIATQETGLVVSIVCTLVAIVILARLDSWRRLYLITLVLLFGAGSNQQVLADIAFYGRYVAAGALAAWTWRNHGGQATTAARLAPPARLLVYGMWAAVLVAVVSIAWSVDRALTMQQTVALALLAATLHGLLTRRWQERQRITGDFAVAYWFFTAVFSASLLAYLAGLPDTATIITFRLQGLFANPNTLATTCGLILPIGWGLYRETQRSRYLVALLPGAAALQLTETRTALLAVVLAVIWLLARGTPSIAAFGGALLALGYTGAWAAGSLGLLPQITILRDAAALLNETSDSGFTDRTTAWSFAIERWGEQPLEGYGYAAGPTLFERSRGIGLLNFRGDAVHNSYLQWLLETGMFGLLPIGALLAASLWAARRACVSGMGCGLVGAVVAGLVIQLGESTMFGTGTAYPLVFWSAVAGAIASSCLPIEDRRALDQSGTHVPESGSDRPSGVVSVGTL